jgi:hypothetical protein
MKLRPNEEGAAAVAWRLAVVAVASGAVGWGWAVAEVASVARRSAVVVAFAAA